MPANLPPQYLKAEDDYRKATTPADRLERLKDLYLLIPKHKGTEKLQCDLKTKMSRVRDEIEAGPATGKKTGAISHRVPSDGAGQVALVGPANTGKSSLLAALTNAKPEVAPYPFTTRVPYPGMMHWEDVRVQLIDLPPVTPEFFESWTGNIVRSADAALLVIDLGDDDIADSAQASLARLAQTRTELVGQIPYDEEDLTIQHVKTLCVANKVDADGALDRLEIVREWFGDRFPILSVSAQTGAGLDDLRCAVYDLLGVIRIYTKVPGKPIDRAHPFTMPRGSTVLDLAREVHRDFEQSLKYAKIWGSGVFDGQTVKRDHELHASDVVELHV